MPSPLQRALDLKSNKFVEACAGAGKTFALSKRYCAILDDFIKKNRSLPGEKWLGVENILVITFTKKATAEMAERIYRDLNTLINGEQFPELEKAGISFGEAIINASPEEKNWLRSTFSQNQISTIDSLCVRILKEHADFLDLDPKFTLAEETDGERIFRETLDSFIQSKSRTFDNDLKNVLDNTALNSLESFFIYLHRNQIFLEEYMEDFGDSPDEAIFENWCSSYTPEFDTGSVLNRLERICGITSYLANGSSQAISLLSEIKEKFETAETIPGHLELRRYILLELLPPLLKDDKSYRSITSLTGRKSDWSEPDAYKDFKEDIQELLVFLDENFPVRMVRSTPSDIDLRSIPVMKSLFRLQTNFEQHLLRRKKKSNYLTFNDVIYLTKKVLTENDDVRMRYARKFKHIMVDEFQDTNYPRWEIIRLLASDEKQELNKKGIYIVGDKKQSIYRFNHAEVEVMEEAKTELGSVRFAEDDVVIEFNDNYRSGEKYIQAVINPIFSQILKPAAKQQPKSFEAVFSETQAEGITPDKKRISALTETCCTIQASFYEKHDNKNEVSALNSAFAVKDFLNWAEKCDLTQKGNPVIGILLRKFTNIQSYLKVFQHYNIPFEIVDGKELYAQQEAKDLFHLVSILINPHNDLALTGLLRSPVFHLSDADIHQMRPEKRGKNVSIYAFLKEQGIYKAIPTAIDHWREKAQHLPLDRLIESIFGTENREFGYFSEAGALQSIANIDKLINIVHNHSLNGEDLRTVFAYLKFNIENNSSTAQAGLQGSAPVQILTIHKAKGLEFPAVIIPEMDRFGSMSGSSILQGTIENFSDGVQQREVGITLMTEDESAIRPGILQSLINSQNEKDDAEDKRLFYVAVTRAQYRVAFLADFSEKDRKYGSTWWYNYLQKFYRFPDIKDENSWDSFTPHLPQTLSQIVTCKDLKEKLSRGMQKEIRQIAWTETPRYNDAKKYLTVSVHDVMDSVSTETKNEEQSESKNSLALGNIFHKLMEMQWWDYDTHEEKIAGYIERFYDDPEQTALLKEIKNHLAIFKNSEISSKLRDVSSEYLFHELSVMGWLNNTGTFLQVSGNIDLLYKHSDQWYVLDYKTGTQHEKYRHQVQTYLWMVRQLYGIEAIGQIYYSSSGNVEEVIWDEYYFSKIYEAGEDAFSFTDLSRVSTFDEIEKILSQPFAGKTIMINPTKHRSLEVLKSMAHKNLLNPNIRSLTIKELIQAYETAERKIGGQLSRQLVKKLLKTNNPAPGMVSYLASAFENSEEWKVDVSNRHKLLFDSYKKSKKQYNWFSETDILDAIGSDDRFWENTRVIVNNFLYPAPKYFEFFSRLSMKAREFYFINNFEDNSIEREFTWEPSIWEKLNSTEDLHSSQDCEICLSVENEVERAAKHILSIKDWESGIETIKLGVSSPERYVPVIKKIFDGFGIPTRTAKNEPIKERPIVQLLLKLLDLLENRSELRWDTIAAVYLHPLLSPGDGLFSMDKFFRTKGISSVSNFAEFNREFSDFKDLSPVFENWYAGFTKDILEADIADVQAVSECVQNFTDKYNIEDKLRSEWVSEGALEKTLNIIDEITDSYKTLDMSGGIESFRIDFWERITETETPTIEQDYGIEIVGFLDTLHIEPEHLLLIGMTEGQFPAEANFNPFLTTPLREPWALDVLKFRYWKNLGAKVTFFAPLKSKNDEALQLSTFVEFLNIIYPQDHKRLADSHRLSPRHHYASYINAKIINPDDNLLLQRHNAYTEDQPSIYKGLVGENAKNEIHLSPTQMDELLSCPMKYWLKRVIRISPVDLDVNAVQRMEKGSMLHTALERFGRHGGFDVLKEDFNAACTLLHDELHKTFEENNLHIDDDLVAARKMKPFIQNLSKKDADNILVKLLEWNFEHFKEYEYIDFEKRFGDEENEGLVNLKDGDVTLTFNGKIDKIMINQDEKTVVAADYKTGNVRLKDVPDLWSSQFLIYYLALKSLYPEYDVKLCYEQIKSPRENGLSAFIGDIDPKHDKKGICFCRGEIKEDRNVMDVDKACKTLLHFAQKAISGYFHLTERDLHGRPCNQCEFTGICRKDTFEK